MLKAPDAEHPVASSRRGKFAHTVMVLQGGSALGAYQAGIYAALAEAAVAPDWIVGVSIGTINAALIAGNPIERRVERLREIWQRVSAYAPFVPPLSHDRCGRC